MNRCVHHTQTIWRGIGSLFCDPSFLGDLCQPRDFQMRFTTGKLVVGVENEIRELLEKLFSTRTQIDFDKNGNWFRQDRKYAGTGRTYAVRGRGDAVRGRSLPLDTQHFSLSLSLSLSLSISLFLSLSFSLSLFIYFSLTVLIALYYLYASAVQIRVNYCSIN